MKPVIGAILAGGRSRRFGSPKELATLGGESLLARLLAAHREALGEVVLVAAARERYALLSVEVIPDLHPGLGPMGGLHAALRHAAARGAGGVCFTPCDTPFIDAGCLRALKSARDGFDAVLAGRGDGGGYEPLIGWYSIAVLPLVEDSIACGRLAMRDLAERISSRRILPASALSSATDPAVLFTNVNTQADLEAAHRALSKR